MFRTARRTSTPRARSSGTRRRRYRGQRGASACERHHESSGRSASSSAAWRTLSPRSLELSRPYGMVESMTAMPHSTNVPVCPASSVTPKSLTNKVGRAAPSAPTAWPPSIAALYHAIVQVRRSSDVVAGSTACSSAEAGPRSRPIPFSIAAAATTRSAVEGTGEGDRDVAGSAEEAKSDQRVRVVPIDRPA